MKKDELRKAWHAAAMMSGAVTGAIFLYVAAVEGVEHFIPFTPPFTGFSAAALRYVLYSLSFGVLFMFIRSTNEEPRGNSVADAIRSLRARALRNAALCELPALAGFVLFFLVGGYWDFYQLAAFSFAMQLIHFPRYKDWEAKAREVYGLLLE